MLFSKFVLGALSLLVIASATPTALESRASPTVTVCTGSLQPANGCVTIPIVNESCVKFKGGLTFLNKKVSNALIPGGYVCTFFKNANCVVNGASSAVFLTSGSWSFFSVPGASGLQNFNDQASSFACSPI
ncbi:hypothetical protein BDQ12DRAFT_759922 [Crucibulum laeve]|uniref:Uncharacterized protein n=1 Tax=Crucibulum laeve TaxID=68775 RepID=A0A5C3LQ66_9AGAR|nr:hypothetical protein BDQ12DRAFT_759922 [Crucibulum laeve]